MFAATQQRRLDRFFTVKPKEKEAGSSKGGKDAKGTKRKASVYDDISPSPHSFSQVHHQDSSSDHQKDTRRTGAKWRASKRESLFIPTLSKCKVLYCGYFTLILRCAIAGNLLVGCV